MNKYTFRAGVENLKEGVLIFLGAIVFIPYAVLYLLSLIVSAPFPYGHATHNWVWNVKGGKRPPWRKYMAEAKERRTQERGLSEMMKTSDKIARTMRKAGL